MTRALTSRRSAFQASCEVIEDEAEWRSFRFEPLQASFGGGGRRCREHGPARSSGGRRRRWRGCRAVGASGSYGSFNLDSRDICCLRDVREERREGRRGDVAELLGKLGRECALLRLRTMQWVGVPGAGIGGRDDGPSRPTM